MEVASEYTNRFLHKLAFIAPGGSSLRPYLHRLRGVKLGKNVWLGQYVFIDEDHPEGVIIKDNSTIGTRTTILNHLYWGRRTSDSVAAEVVIEKNVYLGACCLILPGVKIGEGSVIMGGTVVSRNVPAFTFLGPPRAVALGRVTVPLTKDSSHEEFVRGLRPFRNKRPGG